MQSPYDGAPARYGFTHEFELEGLAIAPSFEAQQLVFFGVDYFELDALALGRFNQFDASRLQLFTVGRVGDGLRLNGGVDNDASKFLLVISFKLTAI